MKNRTIRQGTVVVALAIAGMSQSVNGQTTVTYVGPANGVWSNPANWSTGVVPQNSGANTYNAIIPAGVQLSYDLPAGTITGLSLAAGSSLSLVQGRSLDVLGVALIRGDIAASDSLTRFNSPGVGVSFGNNARLAATSGARITALGVSYTFDRESIETTFSASGNNSLLNLSALQTIRNDGPAGGFSTTRNSQSTWRAASGGVIDLSGLRTLIGGAGPTNGLAANFFVVEAGGDIRMPALQTVTRYNYFDIRVPTYALDSLESAEGLTVNLSAGTTLSTPTLGNVAGAPSNFILPSTAAWSAPSLGALSDTTLDLSFGATFDAPNLQVMRNSTYREGPFKTFIHGALTEIDNSRFAATGGTTFSVAATSYTYDREAIETVFEAVGAGSRLDLSSIQQITNAGPGGGFSTSRNSQSSWRATIGGIIDLSGLRTLIGGVGPTNGVAANYFIADASSDLRMPALQTITRYNYFDIRQPNFDLPALLTAHSWTVSLGIGTNTHTPLLTTLSDPSQLSVSEFASWSAPMLSTMNDTTLILSSGGTFDAPNLHVMRNSTYVEAPGKTFVHGALTDVDNSRFSATGGTTFTVQAASYSYNREAIETVFEANGTGSRLDLSSIQLIQNSGPAGGFSTTRNSQSTWRATGGGVIDLSGLRTLIGGVGPTNGIAANYFVADAAGSINFGKLDVTRYNGFSIDGASSFMQFNGVRFLDLTPLAVSNVGQLRTSGDFAFTNAAESSLSLGEGKLVLNGGGVQSVEVGGTDLGLPSQVGAIVPNFQIGQLDVGQITRATVGRLVDNIDNGNRGTGGAAELLYAQGLPGENGVRVLGGSTLVLDGITLYAVIGNVWMRVNDLIPAGQDIVAYDGGFLSRNANVVGGGWKTNGSSNWSAAANWYGNVSPNGAGKLALFGPTATSPISVTVDGNKTVGYIGFDNANTHTIAGTSTLTMQATGGARVEVRQGNHVINAPLQLASNTTFDIGPSGSTLTIADLATTNANVAITKVGDGAAVVNTVRAKGLTIERGTLRIASSGIDASVSRVASLSIADDAATLGLQPQGTLDLTNNAMVIDYTLVSPRPQVSALIATAYHGGAWDGPGVSSTLAALTRGRAVGYAEASSLGISQFRGQVVDGTTLLVAFTLAGDADLNRAVGFSDLVALAQAYGGAGQWINGDADYNDQVNFADLVALAQNYGGSLLSDGTISVDAATAARFDGDWQLARSLAPEPGPITLAVSALTILSRRRSQATQS